MIENADLKRVCKSIRKLIYDNFFRQKIYRQFKWMMQNILDLHNNHIWEFLTYGRYRLGSMTFDLFRFFQMNSTNNPIVR